MGGVLPHDPGGITASAATQFHRGNFIVVLVSIEQIDLRKMLQSKLDEKQMKRFDQVTKPKLITYLILECYSHSCFVCHCVWAKKCWGHCSAEHRQVMYYLEFLPSWVKADLQNIILMQAPSGLHLVGCRISHRSPST